MCVCVLYIYTYIFIYELCVYIYTYIFIYSYIHIYTHTHIHTYIHTYTHTHTHTHIHIYIHTHIHTHIHGTKREYIRHIYMHGIAPASQRPRDHRLAHSQAIIRFLFCKSFAQLIKEHELQCAIWNCRMTDKDMSVARQTRTCQLHDRQGHVSCMTDNEHVSRCACAWVFIT